MRRCVVAALAIAVPGLAAADGHKLLVLQSEGRADAAVRSKIDAAITRLAAAAVPQAVAGELTFSDAATAVGCKPDAPACKDEVLGMLGVDEIVITTVSPKPGGLEIAIRRVVKGGAAREAAMLLPAGAPPDRLDGLAPVFAERPGDAPAPVIPAPATVTAPPRPVPETAPADPAAGAAPAPVDQPGTLGHRLELAGMVGGAAMATLGLVLWAGASGVQDDIDHAPTRTRQDLAHLQDLEARGDGYATTGNVLVIGGLIAGGVATYFYLRDRRAASTTTARLLPTVLDHGAGVVLTLGAVP
jgi:hypothetical protein